MPNQITTTGIQTASQSELVTQYTDAFEDIYSDDINLNPDTPDGQMMMIFIQTVLDIEDLIVQVFNMFDPDNAIGVILDQRVAINGIQRQVGTFSTTDITITASQSINLAGLDQDTQPVFTVQDAQGNQWELITSQSGLGIGAHVLLFQAASPGAVLTTPNTITIPVTVVLGVAVINNPTSQTTIGIPEETDAQLKVRRQISVSLPSQGYLAGLLAALLNISGVTFAAVYENDSGTTDINGVPGHSIWVIVAGTGADSDIANAIYTKRNAGCGMFGSIDYGVTRPDGSVFLVFWDTVTTENLFIKFTATSLDGVSPPNIAAIRAGLVSSFVPGVAAEVNINVLATAVQAIDPNTLVTNAGFSLSEGGSYTNTLTPTLKDQQFLVTQPNIIITPIVILPASATVATTATQQFNAFGGFGAYTWSLSTNNSGGSIDSSTGLYTAGSTGNVSDVVEVTDGASNTAQVTVTVTT